MSRKLTTLAAVFGLVLAGLLAIAPAAASAPAKVVPASGPTLITAENATAEQRAQYARVPVLANQVVAYEHASWQNEIYRSDVSGKCLVERKFYPSASVALRMSSVLLWVPDNATYCNYLYVVDKAFNKWGTCVNKNTWGYSFGWDYNDDVWIIGVSNAPVSCPKWNA